MKFPCIQIVLKVDEYNGLPLPSCHRGHGSALNLPLALLESWK